jgi:hypothetical protein
MAFCVPIMNDTMGKICSMEVEKNSEELKQIAMADEASFPLQISYIKTRTKLRI